MPGRRNGRRSWRRASIEIREDEELEIARNLWRNSRMLLPNTLNLRRWATGLRLLFVINLFVLPIDIFFYHRLVISICGTEPNRAARTRHTSHNHTSLPHRVAHRESLTPVPHISRRFAGAQGDLRSARLGDRRLLPL